MIFEGRDHLYPFAIMSRDLDLRKQSKNKRRGGIPLLLVLVSPTIIHGIPVEPFQILKDDAVKVLHSICQQIWKTQQWPQDWKRSVFIPIPKKSSAKQCSLYYTIALISHASKVVLKIFKPGFSNM